MTNKKSNILYELHESEFLTLTVKDNDLIFRVAINCGVATNLGIQSEYSEKFYIFDIVCHQYKIIETNYVDNLDLFLHDILSFRVFENNYIFSINLDCVEYIYFIFDFESIEWLPIEVVTGDELYGE